MNEYPSVSVVIPVFNTVDYLDECIGSLRKQSLDSIEIICVDDGSSDGSLDLLEEMAREDHRLTILKQDNKGAGCARNFGLSVAKGEYIICLDSDDFFSENFLSSLYDIAKSSQADIAMCSGFFFDCETGSVTNNDNIYKSSFIGGLDEFSAASLPNRLFQVTTPAPWNKLYRRQFVQDLGIEYQEISNTNDVFFFVSAFACANKIVSTSERLVYYRVNRPGSLQHLDREKNPTAFCDALTVSERFLKEHDRWAILQGSFVVFSTEVIRHNILVSQTFRTFEKVYCGARSILEGFRDAIGGAPFSQEGPRVLAEQILATADPGQGLFLLWAAEKEKVRAGAQRERDLQKKVKALRKKLKKAEEQSKKRPLFGWLSK